MSIFDKMREKAEGKQPSEVVEHKEEKATKSSPKPEPEHEESTPPPIPRNPSARRDDKKILELEKQLALLKEDFGELKEIISSSNQPKSTNRKLTYEEFVEHMLSHRNVGTHYSGYVRQYTGETTGNGKPKKTNFNHIYMIYLDLP